MKLISSKSFTPIHKSTLNEDGARKYSAEAEAEIKPGDVLITYTDPSGLAAQSIIAQDGLAYVNFNDGEGFFYGTLISSNIVSFLVSGETPPIFVDLRDLSCWQGTLC